MVVTAGSGVQTFSAPLDPSALDELAESQNELDKLGDTLAAKMAELHKLQDSFEAAVKKQAKSLNSASSTPQVQAAQKTVFCAPSRSPDDLSATNSFDKETEDPEVRYATRLDELSTRLAQRQKLMPATGGWFVQLFLGSINVRFARKSERMSFKSDYERMKLIFAPFGVVFCIFCLLLPDYRWCHMIFQLTVSCYYITLALRENILRVNGSNIRPWWIIHHYFTMMQGVLILTWPNGDSYARLTNPLHIFGLFNGILMIFQTRYQMARLYSLRALGRAGEMDVASSDNTQIHWSETMTLLLPLILFGQILQGFMAYFLLHLYFTYRKELQILLLALLFIANFVGNVVTTMQVVIEKRSSRVKRKSQSHPTSTAPSSTNASSSQSESHIKES